MTFGEKLRAARIARNLTQEELAKMCGLKQFTIDKLEKNRIKAPTKYLKKTSEAMLKISIPAVNS